MRKPAKRLLAGTSAAIALCAGAAEAQVSGVENDQSLAGGVFAGQTLNVIDPAEGLQAGATATGNAVSARVETGDLAYGSQQAANAPVTAETDVYIHGWSPQTVATAAAIGNAADAAADGGSLNAWGAQAVGYVGPVSASARSVQELSSSGDTAVGATALGNSHNSRAAVWGYTEITQDIRSPVTASADATLLDVLGEASVNAAAVANAAGTDGGAAALLADQVSAGGAVTAAATADVGAGYIVDAAASATANSLSAVHDDAAYLRVEGRQENAMDVASSAALYVGDFGGVTAHADGVGNGIYAGTASGEVILDTDQYNAGGVSASASFEGLDGYDAGVSASAVGNTVTGFACGDCDAALTASNRQVNDGGVSATTDARIYGGTRVGRQVSSTATAIGNNAVYHVSRPQ